ncbi:MAG TPA: hypothetical protein VK184_12335 [Nostocaceae cyanobacterium]|nr:hypothetical protein [Nostocaceae cyanobacterium]
MLSRLVLSVFNFILLFLKLLNNSSFFEKMMIWRSPTAGVSLSATPLRFAIALGGLRSPHLRVADGCLRVVGATKFS